MEDLILSPEQTAVEEDIQGGYSVLATGPAGSGKSTLLNRLRARYEDRLCVTASTGIAAMNVGGTTLNSFAGLGLGTATAEFLADEILRQEGRHFRNITQCEMLAIDEISMVSGELFDLLNNVFKIVRDNESPFGGVGLVVMGDFLQLPPVSKGPKPATFAFESRAWAEADIKTHLFTKVYRQANQPFVDALGRLRIADLHHPSIGLIAGRNNLALPNDDVRPVIIHTHNADVDRLNLIELAKLSGEEKSYEAEDSGRPTAVDRLDRECLAPKLLRLREGAQVMLLANIDPAAGLVNGSLGVVVEMKDTEVLVRFGEHTLSSIERRDFEVQNNGEVLATRNQFPLRLAYAITCHKTQGMTLDRIQAHLTKTFEAGQAYVAVSRVKTLDGLFLKNSTRYAFRAHPKAVAFYERAARARAAARWE